MGRVDILSASAGSGKTFRLALNYIKRLLEEPYDYRHILAVTFTNKATDELKGRILDRLNSLANGSKCDLDEELKKANYDPETIKANATLARNLILHDYNNFAVMTIDKFFQRVMRAFIKEIGVELNFNLELKTDTLLEQAADQMLEKVIEDRNLYAWVMEYIGEQMSDNKSWNIKSAIIKLGDQLFKEEYRHSRISADDKPELARIQKSALAQAAILSKAYQAEGEKFVALMDQHGLTVGDFKDGYRSSVARLAQKIASGEIAEPKTTAYNAVEKDEWHKASKCPAHDTIDAIADQLRPIVANIIVLYPKVAKAHNTKQIIGSHYREFALLADLRSCIDEICSKEDILPLADVSDIIYRLVRDNDAPFIYEKAGNRYDYFMIDEFQDTSVVQWSNFVPLLHNALAQSAENPVLLVGDIKQSIYRWRGGDWTLLSRGVKQEFEDVYEEPMAINRRSTRSVVEFNNQLTKVAVECISANIDEELNKALKGEYIDTHTATALSNMTKEAYCNYTQEPSPSATEGYVSVTAYDKENLYANIIARIEELESRGFRAKDIAILVRDNKEGAKIAAHLLEYKNNPERTDGYIFDVVTEEALAINTSAAVRFVTSCLTMSCNPTDTIAPALYNDYFARPIDEPLSEEEQEFIYSLSLLQPEEAFNEILLHYPTLSQADEIPYLQALHNQIINQCAKSVTDTALFIKWWNEKGCDESVALPQYADAITISTIHKSKGLGYKAVIIPNCDWDIRPHKGTTFWVQPNEPLSEQITKFPATFASNVGQSIFSKSYLTELTMSAIDSLNILYVAITRAIQELHIMVPTKGDKTHIGVVVRQMTGLCNDGDKYEQGTPETYHSPALKIPSPTLFETHSPTNKVAVKYSHQRYDQESRGDHLEPRDMGVLMHRAMEQSKTREDITKQIAFLVTDGIITPEEAATLEEKIDDALSHKGTQEWFDGSWEMVHSEREIVESGRSWRPDRVMTREGEAVVVDYKFGFNRPASHRRQIERYCSLLQQMGYERVSGYLWYITLGDIEQVV